MILVDSDKLELLLENSEAIALNCVFGELLQEVKNESEEKAVLSFWQNLSKVDETNLFVEVGKLSSKYKLLANGVGMIDSAILVTSVKYNFSLWTLDKRLNDANSKLLSE